MRIDTPVDTCVGRCAERCPANGGADGGREDGRGRCDYLVASNIAFGVACMLYQREGLLDPSAPQRHARPPEEAAGRYTGAHVEARGQEGEGTVCRLVAASTLESGMVEDELVCVTRQATAVG